MEVSKLPTMINETQKQTIIDKLQIARSFRMRAQGLIGTKVLPNDEGIWFPNSNWIHTMFMSMSIDVIYLDKNMKVKKLQENLKPWKFPAPVLSARSVLETNAGFIEKNNIQLGDQLNVGD